MPPVKALGSPVAVNYPSPTSWRMVTHAATPTVLRFRLTDVPGWHASIDGRPLVLHRFDGVMLQAKIPSGTHTIELHYWPESFSIGVGVAVATVIVLVLAVVVGRRRQRRHGPQRFGSASGSNPTAPAVAAMATGGARPPVPSSVDHVDEHDDEDGQHAHHDAGVEKVRPVVEFDGVRSGRDARLEHGLVETEHLQRLAVDGRVPARDIGEPQPEDLGVAACVTILHDVGLG